MDKYDILKLDNQLCFPLYALSKEVIRKYKPHLDELNLTYTQYIVLLVLWETDNINVSLLGDKLYLDSGTLTPLLKKLEEKGLIERIRDKSDERNLIIKLTENGLKLKDKALDIPLKVGKCIPISKDDMKTLYEIITKALKNI